MSLYFQNRSRSRLSTANELSPVPVFDPPYYPSKQGLPAGAHALGLITYSLVPWFLRWCNRPAFREKVMNSNLTCSMAQSAAKS